MALTMPQFYKLNEESDKADAVSLTSTEVSDYSTHTESRCKQWCGTLLAMAYIVMLTAAITMVCYTTIAHPPLPHRLHEVLFQRRVLHLLNKTTPEPL